MTTERERIEKLKAEGKVSAEEAQRLLAALDRAEREDVQAAARPGREIARPRLSRLAVAGVVALPVAAGLFVTAFGFGVALGTSYERAAAGGAVAAAASLVAALILGASALVAIRRTPAELRGRGLAWLGVLVPLLLATSAAVAAPRVIEHRRRTAAAGEAEVLAVLFAELAGIAPDKGPVWPQGMHGFMATWGRFVSSLDPVEFTALHAAGKGIREAADRGDMESVMKSLFWMSSQGKSIEASCPDSIMGNKAFRFYKGRRLVFAGATFAPDLTTGEVTLRVVGDEAKGILVPVVNREGRWYFSAEPVRFLGGEPEAPPKEDPVVRRLTITILRDGSLEIVYEGEPEVFPAKLEEFVDEPGRFWPGVDRPIVEIKADPTTPHDKAKALVDALAKAGVTDVTLQTE